MAVRYEWDVEEHEAGEVVNHWFQSSYRQLAGFVAVVTAKPTPGTTFHPVLVRDCDRDGRSWAYMTDGKLPEYTQDAYQRDEAKVPQRYHAEVLRETVQ